MTTLSEFARSAARALPDALGIPPHGCNTNAAASVVMRALRDATRERSGKTRRRLMKAQARAERRFKTLLKSSPAVIYSFKASGDFAPIFVSDNITDVFGYAPAEYLQD
ncbi:MAG: hypothetical protein IRZ04_19015, partial [Rhodospirillales bacterium]|nr:hypothetical protein [Rhodospirillales bacterium]